MLYSVLISLYTLTWSILDTLSSGTTPITVSATSPPSNPSLVGINNRNNNNNNNNNVGILTPGGYLSRKAMEAIDHFTLRSLNFISSELKHHTINVTLDHYIGPETTISNIHNNNNNNINDIDNDINSKSINQEIHVLDFKGNGTLPTMILLHGISSCGADYYPLIRHLQAQSRRVIAIDLPGHGLSASSLDLTLPELVEVSTKTVERCIEELNLNEYISDYPRGKCILLGNSLGGFVAARYAATTGKDDIGGLVLMSPAGAPLSEEELDHIKRVFNMRTLGDACYFVEKVLGKPRYHIPFGVRHVVGWAARERVLRPSVQRMFDEASIGEIRLTEHEIGQIRCPVLLVWGMQESVFSEKHFDWFEHHLKRRSGDSNSKFQVYRPHSLGHIPQLDGALITGAITAFVQRYCMTAVPLGSTTTTTTTDTTDTTSQTQTAWRSKFFGSNE